MALGPGGQEAVACSQVQQHEVEAAKLLTALTPPLVSSNPSRVSRVSRVTPPRALHIGSPGNGPPQITRPANGGGRRTTDDGEGTAPKKARKDAEAAAFMRDRVRQNRTLARQFHSQTGGDTADLDEIPDDVFKDFVAGPESVAPAAAQAGERSAARQGRRG